MLKRAAGVEQEPRKKDRIMRLLYTLAEGGGVLDAETTAERLQVDPFTLWSDVQQLEDTGLIMVGERSRNGRSLGYLILTKKGRNRILRRQ